MVHLPYIHDYREYKQFPSPRQWLLALLKQLWLSGFQRRSPQQWHENSLNQALPALQAIRAELAINPAVADRWGRFL